jgi:hypothetical protein
VFFSVSPSGYFQVLNPLPFTYALGGSEVEFNYTPVPRLVQALDGNFYGAVGSSSAPQYDAFSKLFQLTPNGGATALTTNPSGSCYTVYLPTLAAGPDGTLYGTDGVSCSTLGYFAIAPGGVVTSPSTEPAPLFGIPGGDGNYYSATPLATPSISNPSSIYQYTASGVATSLGSVFDSDPNSTLTGAAAIGPQILTGDGYLAGGATAPNGNTTVTFLFNDPTTGKSDAAPIQLEFTTASGLANRPIALTWKVYGAYTLTAQQCHATVQDNAPGAGTWSGPQNGRLIDGVYTGSASITPTATGTYTYALTCGGTQSGFTTLTVE